MDPVQKRLSKAVDQQLESKWGLVLYLPFAISASITFIAGFITEYELKAGIIEKEWESSSAGVAELFGIMTACFLFLAIPGAFLAIVGFVRRRTRLAWITLAVVAFPWLLIALYILVLQAR